MRYLRWGGGTAKPSSQKKAEAQKTPENAATPQRQVHAVLGAFEMLLQAGTFEHCDATCTIIGNSDVMLATAYTFQLLE